MDWQTGPKLVIPNEAYRVERSLRNFYSLNIANLVCWNCDLIN